MVTHDALPVGMLVLGEVVEHHPWGVDVRFAVSGESVIGTVDIIKVTDERPFQAPDDYPAIGSQVEAVVLGYTSGGQLRLSLSDSDIDPFRESGADEVS